MGTKEFPHGKSERKGRRLFEELFVGFDDEDQEVPIRACRRRTSISREAQVDGTSS